MRHHFTVDVEEYFQVSALEPFVRRAQWDTLESRVAHGVHRLLDLLGQHDALGTFFVLGCVAERTPDVVRTIAAQGHEVASHGWSHRRVTELDSTAFRDEVRRSKSLLEDLTGSKVLGYRAPSFSIVRGQEWALEILAEEGHAYDSSLFPVARAGYGYVGGRRDPHWLDVGGQRLYEVPPATLRLLGLTLPAGGGAYFRLLPSVLVERALDRAERRGVPGTFYLHPWELDPDQPRFDVGWGTRIRHYGGLRGTRCRLERLLSRFRFTTIASQLPVSEALAQRS